MAVKEFFKAEQKFLLAVKLLPWAQFVGAWLAVGGLLAAALARGGFWFTVGHIIAVTGVAIGAVAFVFSVIHKPGLFGLSHLLDGAGLIVAGIAAVLLGVHPVFLSFVAFLGLGVSQAGQWYDEIYP
ncbi:MAG TPA: hypothetical protein VGR34_06475 [Candidatus Dormibacteraeota bacterium]|nr:hypothetical protein [Candidatus Dormibacteraeota bacterium]